MYITTETPTKRRKVTKFALAGVAVLGVGAAATSAAWSDNVFFAGATDSADFDLDGSVDRVNWVELSSELAPITIPSSAFDTVAPGITDTYDVWVRNSGDIPVYLNPAVVEVTGIMKDFVTKSAVYSRTTIPAGQDARVRVSLTGTNTLPEETSGFISIRVEGSSSAPVPAPAG